MQLLATKVCKKSDLGVHNNLFGGTMLSWIDEGAVAYVNEVCFSPNMVTLKMDEVTFRSPVKENNLIKLYGDIAEFGNSTIRINADTIESIVGAGTCSTPRRCSQAKSSCPPSPS